MSTRAKRRAPSPSPPSSPLSAASADGGLAEVEFKQGETVCKVA